MEEWFSIRECLPLNDSFVRVKFFALFKSEKECLFTARYFVSRGENITPWVTHWRPTEESEKYDWMD